MASPIYRGGRPFFAPPLRFKSNVTLPLTGAAAPTNAVTGAGFAGIGSLYVRTSNGAYYINTGTKASPVWSIIGTVASDSVTTAMLQDASVTSAKLAANTLQVASGTISSANITGTSAGQLGHANGVVLVAAGGAHVINEFVSAIIIVDFATAAYTGGGNTGIKIGGGGAALSGVVANTVIVQASADIIQQFVPLAATALTPTENTSLNLVTASAPTQPGTAAGVIRWICTYRQHATGL